MVVVGSWDKSRRVASVGWWQGGEPGPLGIKVVAEEPMGLVLLGGQDKGT